MNKECTLSDEGLIEACDNWISSLASTGGKSWCLSIPVNFDRDPDMLFSELIKRFKDRKDDALINQAENAARGI
jgi:hypothetical protein